MRYIIRILCVVIVTIAVVTAEAAKASEKAATAESQVKEKRGLISGYNGDVTSGVSVPAATYGPPSNLKLLSSSLPSGGSNLLSSYSSGGHSSGGYSSSLPSGGSGLSSSYSSGGHSSSGYSIGGGHSSSSGLFGGGSLGGGYSSSGVSLGSGYSSDATTLGGGPSYDYILGGTGYAPSLGGGISLGSGNYYQSSVTSLPAQISPKPTTIYSGQKVGPVTFDIPNRIVSNDNYQGLFDSYIPSKIQISSHRPSEPSYAIGVHGLGHYGSGGSLNLPATTYGVPPSISGISASLPSVHHDSSVYQSVNPFVKDNYIPTQNVYFSTSGAGNIQADSGNYLDISPISVGLELPSTSAPNFLGSGSTSGHSILSGTYGVPSISFGGSGKYNTGGVSGHSLGQGGYSYDSDLCAPAPAGLGPLHCSQNNIKVPSITISKIPSSTYGVPSGSVSSGNFGGSQSHKITNTYAPSSASSFSFIGHGSAPSLPSTYGVPSSSGYSFGYASPQVSSYKHVSGGYLPPSVGSSYPTYNTIRYSSHSNGKGYYP